MATKLFPLAAVRPGRRPPGPGQPAPPRRRTRSTSTRSTGTTRWCPVRATMRRWPSSQREGLVRHVGVSNFSLAQLAGGRAGPRRPGPVQPGPLQPDRPGPRGRAPPLGPGQRPAGHRLQPARARASFRPLRPRPPADGAAGRDPGLPPRERPPAGPAARRAARRWPTPTERTCSQVALAWLLRRPNVVVIPGASSVAQAEANAAAADLELTDDEDAGAHRGLRRLRPVAGRGRGAGTGPGAGRAGDEPCAPGGRGADRSTGAQRRPRRRPIGWRRPRVRRGSGVAPAAPGAPAGR